MQLANKLGITPQYVTSTEYSKSTKRKQSEHFEDLEILGYEVTQTFTVEINNIIQYSPFVDQLLGMMNVGNIRTAFDVANREEIDSELLTKATKNAKQKAEDLAKGMNVKVGSVFALTQDYSFASFEAVFGAPEHQSYSAPPDFVPPPSFDFVPDQEGSNMFIPKTIELKKAVSVVFKIK